MSNPYFNAGDIIGGERFLGRKREIRRIQERLLGNSGYASAAVIGLPKVGKSSLVQKAILDDADVLAKARKIIALRLEVGTMNSFGQLLTDLVRETTQRVAEFGHGTGPIEKQSAEALKAGPNQQWFEVHTFFRLLKKAGIRVICVLDEFDAGRYTLKDNPQSFHALRELASMPYRNSGIDLAN
jgi:AAA+ ATPase superfamily predicted ATPase